MTGAEYQEALKNAAKSMVRVKNPRRLLRMMTRFIDREVGLTHTSILIHESTKNRYIFVDSKGDQKFPVQLIRLDHDNPIVDWFLKYQKTSRISRDYVTLGALDCLLEEKRNEGNQEFAEKIVRVQEAMRTLRASVGFPGYFKGELLGILLLGDKISGEPFSEEEFNFFQTLTFDAAMAIKNAEYQKTLIQKNEELAAHLEEIKALREKEKQNYYQVMLSLATEVDEKDRYTFEHTTAVVHWGLLLAEELGFNIEGSERHKLIAALRLHDIGKIGIPDAILKKPGSLTHEEFEIMKQHTTKGARILEPLADFEDAAKAVLHHHENFDGTGYPRGLRGEEIPYTARLVAIADAFHAMVVDRPYHKAIPEEDAIAELKRFAGVRYDPVMVEAFERAYRKEAARRSTAVPA